MQRGGEWIGRGKADLDGEALEGVALWHRVANALRPRERKTGYEPPERVFASPPSATTPFSEFCVSRLALELVLFWFLASCPLAPRCGCSAPPEREVTILRESSQVTIHQRGMYA